jgi:hypothetical protein
MTSAFKPSRATSTVVDHRRPDQPVQRAAGNARVVKSGPPTPLSQSFATVTRPLRAYGPEFGRSLALAGPFRLEIGLSGRRLGSVSPQAHEGSTIRQRTLTLAGLDVHASSTHAAAIDVVAGALTRARFGGGQEEVALPQTGSRKPSPMPPDATPAASSIGTAGHQTTRDPMAPDRLTSLLAGGWRMGRRCALLTEWPSRLGALDVTLAKGPPRCADRCGTVRGPRTASSLENSAMAALDTQAAATGSRLFAGGPALSIVLVSGLAPRVI